MQKTGHAQVQVYILLHATAVGLVKDCEVAFKTTLGLTHVSANHALVRSKFKPFLLFLLLYPRGTVAF